MDVEFGIRGVSLSFTPAIRLDVNTAQENILSLSSSKIKDKETPASDGEEEEDGFLMKRPQTRRQIVLEDEKNIS